MRYTLRELSAVWKPRPQRGQVYLAPSAGRGRGCSSTVFGSSWNSTGDGGRNDGAVESGVVGAVDEDADGGSSCDAENAGEGAGVTSVAIDLSFGNQLFRKKRTGPRRWGKSYRFSIQSNVFSTKTLRRRICYYPRPLLSVTRGQGQPPRSPRRT